MATVTANLWSNIPSAEKKGELLARSEQPVPPEVGVESRIQRRQSHDRNSHFLEKILTQSRVLISEGIPGSGKDTFQAYLNEWLKNRVVYDYSEGELLHSWK